MKFNPLSRRHFLQGIGRAALALPLLPSLMPRNAFAQNIERPKFFVFMCSGHGAVNYENMYPQFVDPQSSWLYQNLGHQVQWEALSNLTAAPRIPELGNGQQELSPVLGSFLNSYLDKINVIQGLDITIGYAHQRAYLGNFHGSDLRDAGANMDPRLTLSPMRSVDQVMANSPNFYTALDSPSNPAMNFGFGESISWTIQGGQMAEREVLFAPALFDSLFQFGDTGANQDQINVLDRVFEDYQRLTASTFGPGKLLSRDDKIRLEQFADELNETQSRLRNSVRGCIDPSVSLSSGDRPAFNLDTSSYSSASERYSELLDVMMLAFRCGRSRIATFNSYIVTESAVAGTWHDDVAHRHKEESYEYGRDQNGNLIIVRPQTEIVISNRFAAEHIFTAILQRMNEDMGLGDGTTYLDQALVCWQQESGHWTHSMNNIPTVMAGSAGGYFNTGYMVDYRNHTNEGPAHSEIADGLPSLLRAGIPMQRWLRDVLLSMNVQQSEFFRNDMYGYGDPFVDVDLVGGPNSYPQQVLEGCNSSLPFIVSQT